MEKNNEFNEKLKNEKFDEIYGQFKVKREIKSALLMKRHIAIFGQPGIGKTTLAKNIAKILPTITVNDCGYNCLPNEPICPKCKTNSDIKKKEITGIQRFIRVQGSPDLTVEDLIGDIDPIKAIEFGPTSKEAFTPGKIFKANQGILFFDEINRCPEKLQNALLQVLEERKATISNYEIDFKTDFILIATMNPKDINTERLSDVLLDRFDVIYMDYPEDLETEKKIITIYGKNFVTVSDDIKNIIVGFVRKIRENDKLEKVPSVRATLGLYERAQSNAFLNNRNKVILNDVKESINSVITHRIRLKPSVKYLKNASSFIKEEFEKFTEDTSVSSSSDFDSKGDDP